MKVINVLHDNLDLIECPQNMSRQDSRLHPQFHEAKHPHELDKTRQALILFLNPPVLPDTLAIHSIPTLIPCEAPKGKEAHQALLANLDHLVKMDRQVHLAPEVHQARLAHLDHQVQLVLLHMVP